MPKTKRSITIECRYFNWRLRLRKNGIWQADARGCNKLKGRRHSLGTRDLEEAKRLVHLLDEQMAADQGLISYQSLFNRSEFNLTIEAGFAAYQKHIERPRVAGGPKSSSSQRYGRILRAFQKYFEKMNVQYCEQITEQVLNGYAVDRKSRCKDSSIKLELTQVRTVLNFLRDAKFLSPDTHFKYQTKKLKKSKRRYCPLRDEAVAILKTLQAEPKLSWLFNATMMLFNTGLRLSEIAQMTSHDINLRLGVIWVLDEEEDEESDKETKTGESRFLPITSELRPILEKLVTSDDRRLFNGARGGRLRSDSVNDNLRSNVLIPLKEHFPHSRFQSITAHCLRHFFETYATYCGISKTEIDAWMGHGTCSMGQHYFHNQIEFACESIKKFKPLLADKTCGETDKKSD
jgi:integrase